jgi:hypothetical protein
VDRLFLITNGASLTLENNITLRGIATGQAALVDVTNGSLTMKTGSSITGHTVSANGTASGAVSIELDGSFVMEGGTITGNANNLPYTYPTGGVYVQGSFTMSGGTINNNINAFSNLADVTIFGTGTITLSGTAQIGALMLNAAGPTQRARVVIGGAYTGSVNTLNLRADSSNLTDVINFWTVSAPSTAVVIAGATAPAVPYSLAASDITKFTLGNFISDFTGGTRSIANNDLTVIGQEDWRNYRIEDTGANIGKLVQVAVGTKFEISITDAGPSITPAIPDDTVLTLSRTAAGGNARTATLSVAAPVGSTYTAVNWYVTGTTIEAEDVNTIILDATHRDFFKTGTYFLTVELLKNGVPYNTTIEFKVVE